MVNLVFIIGSLLVLAIVLNQCWRQRDYEYRCMRAKQQMRRVVSKASVEQQRRVRVRGYGGPISSKTRVPGAVFIELNKAAYQATQVRRETPEVLSSTALHRRSSSAVGDSYYDVVA
ncbi:MAG TPA: hypothetical protein GX717_01450 [Clostridiaceae bacterium]|nr:hypothetical protein [Clostridiaceae bacterium]